MGLPWETAFMDVQISYEDVLQAHFEASERGETTDILTVGAEVDIDDALAEASQEKIRAALEVEGYTNEQLDAIRDCFASVASGDAHTAAALLGRIFDHPAQIVAAERGMAVCPLRQAA